MRHLRDEAEQQRDHFVENCVKAVRPMTIATYAQPIWPRVRWLVLGAVIATVVSVYLAPWLKPPANIVIDNTLVKAGGHTMITLRNAGWTAAKSVLISLKPLSSDRKYVRLIDYDGRCKPYSGEGDFLPKTLQCEMVNSSDPIRFGLYPADFDILEVHIVTDGHRTASVYRNRNGKLSKLS